MLRRAAYLCIQSTLEGQASYAHVNEIIDGLRRRGIQVDLYEPRRPGGRGAWGLVRRALAFLAVQGRLLPRLRGYDALYVRGHVAAAPSVFAARLLGVPQVQEVNGPVADLFVMYPWTRHFRVPLRALVRAMHLCADAIITVTPQMAAWCAKEYGHTRIHVVPNGANLAFFHPGARSPEAPRGPYAIFFGAFSPWQGIDTMLEAVRCPEWPAGMRLVLAGDGVERPKVEAAAAAGGPVVYLGVKPYRDLAGFVAPAAVGLCVKDDGGTHAESGWSPLKLYEMMATGIPVVVTDLPGQSEVVEAAGAGLIIPPGDAAALARAVARLVEHPEAGEAMGARGHALIAQEHSWDQRAHATLDVLDGIVAGGAPR